MNNVEINKQARLSQHFTLGELCKTSAKTQDGNIPSHVHIENLKRLCGWLEMLRSEWNKRYGDGDDPIVINSAYRSWEVNKKAGGFFDLESSRWLCSGYQVLRQGAGFTLCCYPARYR